MTMRGYNFGAGPATLPESILVEAQAELLDWQGLGMSVLEVGHRTEPFMQLMQDAEADLRDILAIPPNYQVLFLPFPARMQFSMIPLNLMQVGKRLGGFLVSGTWSELAYQEALHVSGAYCLASSADSTFTTPLSPAEATLQAGTGYVYYTPNETIQGIRFPYVPAYGLPLVADMTSCLLSEQVSINDYALIFAGAQKNIAPAGLTILIARDELIPALSCPGLPTMLNYATHATAHSLYATPAAFQCYLAAKMFRWIKAQGGVTALQQQNQAKAQALYAYIDASSSYLTRVQPEWRSLTNVCFFLKNPEREAAFLTAAHARGLYGLKGHRLVGGLRASLYNAMPMAGVEALIAFMQAFEE